MTRFATFDAIECAVLAELICFPDRSLPLVPDLEIDDFSPIFRRAVFTAIRNVQARGERIEVLAIADELFAQWQLANDDKCTERDEAFLTCELAMLVDGAEMYRDEYATLLPRHARQLRTIRFAREERVA